MVGLYFQFATATSPRRLLLMLHCVWIRVINVIHSIAADINPDTSVLKLIQFQTWYGAQIAWKK